MTRMRERLRARSTFDRQLVSTGTDVTGYLPAWSKAMSSSAFRGSAAFLLATVLACTSAFRSKLIRRLRFGAFLGAELRPLRALQLGHPGDYVLAIGDLRSINDGATQSLNSLQASPTFNLPRLFLLGNLPHREKPGEIVRFLKKQLRTRT